jgi:hypothetical protein
LPDVSQRVSFESSDELLRSAFSFSPGGEGARGRFKTPTKVKAALDKGVHPRMAAMVVGVARVAEACKLRGWV